MSKPVRVRFHSAWIALALLFAAPAISWGQSQVAYSISGLVSDKANQPLIGVAVQLLETRQGTLTDLDGKYVLEGTVASGTYTLQMSYLGYANFTKTITIDNHHFILPYPLDFEQFVQGVVLSDKYDVAGRFGHVVGGREGGEGP